METTGKSRNSSNLSQTVTAAIAANAKGAVATMAATAWLGRTWNVATSTSTINVKRVCNSNTAEPNNSEPKTPPTVIANIVSRPTSDLLRRATSQAKTAEKPMITNRYVSIT